MLLDGLAVIVLQNPLCLPLGGDESIASAFSIKKKTMSDRTTLTGQRVSTVARC